MARDTYVGVFGTSQLVVMNESLIDKNRVVQRRTNGADIFAGAMVGEVAQTFPDVILSATGTIFTGIAWRHSNDTDIPEGWQNPNAAVAGATPDYLFADNVYIDVILPHGGALQVGLFMSPGRTTPANNITGNETLKISVNDAGELDITSTPAYPLVVGKASSDQAITVGSTDAKIVVVNY